MLKFTLLLLLFLTTIYAKEINLLKDASIYLDYKHSSFNDIKDKYFTPISTNHINYSFNAKAALWVRFELHNSTNISEDSVIEVDNPLLESVTFYDPSHRAYQRGMLHISKKQKHIYPHLHVNLPPHSRSIYYLHVKNTTTALQFSLHLVDTESFLQKDTTQQFSIIFFIGIITAFLVYSLALYFYSKDVSYFYYAIYIATLLFQQLTYVGFLPLYMPPAFTKIDNYIVVFKVGMMIITAALFARSFLKTAQFVWLDTIYKYFIYAVLIQIALFSTPYLYLPEITIITGLFFIFFNLFSGVYVYIHGNIQARFFIAGWSILIIGYFFSIIDALGIYSAMYYFPQLIMLSTTFEALFLLLAFVDKLNILQTQKEIADRTLFEELSFRKERIEKEVKSRTNALHLLYKELHHRVKNNLQIILSIIRLQGDKIEDKKLKDAFYQLEGRINSIAKTHDILYQNETQETIDMKEYINSLITDIEASLPDSNIDIAVNTSVKMPLKEAVYVGLVINELISNAYKHSMCDTITLRLEKENHSYHLHVSDNGIGFQRDTHSNTSLGLKLVNTLVTNQLNGTIKTNTLHGSNYDIRFTS